MHSRIHILLLILTASFFTQCEKKTTPPVELPSPVIPLEAHTLRIALNHSTNITIQAQVPPGYTVSEFKENVFLAPATDKPAFTRPRIRYSVDCSGLCDESIMPENIQKHFQELKNRTYRTDTFVTPTVTTLGEGLIGKQGRWLAAHIDYPEDTKQDGSTLEGLQAWGLHYVPEKPYFIVAYTTAPLDTSAEAWDVLVHAIQQPLTSP